MHEEEEHNGVVTQGEGAEGAGVAEQQEVGIATVPLRPDHNVAGFVLPKSAQGTQVRDFLVQHADTAVQDRYSRVFVLENPEDRTQIWAYYSLAASSVVVDIIEPAQRGVQLRKLQRQHRVPMALLGFMGRHDDKYLGGQDFGAYLLYDAALRVQRAAEDLGIWGIWLNAHNEKLVGYYQWCRFSRAFPIKTGAAPSLQMYASLETLLAPE